MGGFQEENEVWKEKAKNCRFEEIFFSPFFPLISKTKRSFILSVKLGKPS